MDGVRTHVWKTIYSRVRTKDGDNKHSLGLEGAKIKMTASVVVAVVLLFQRARGGVYKSRVK